MPSISAPRPTIAWSASIAGATGGAASQRAPSAGSSVAANAPISQVSPAGSRAARCGTWVCGKIRLVLGITLRQTPARASGEKSSAKLAACAVTISARPISWVSRRGSASVRGMAKPPSVASSGRAADTLWARRCQGARAMSQVSTVTSSSGDQRDHSQSGPMRASSMSDRTMKPRASRDSASMLSNGLIRKPCRSLSTLKPKVEE